MGSVIPGEHEWVCRPLGITGQRPDGRELGKHPSDTVGHCAGRVPVRSPCPALLTRGKGLVFRSCLEVREHGSGALSSVWLTPVTHHRLLLSSDSCLGWVESRRVCQMQQTAGSSGKCTFHGLVLPEMGTVGIPPWGWSSRAIVGIAGTEPSARCSTLLGGGLCSVELRVCDDELDCV